MPNLNGGLDSIILCVMAMLPFSGYAAVSYPGDQAGSWCSSGSLWCTDMTGTFGCCAPMTASCGNGAYCKTSGGGGGADKRHAYMRGSSPVAAGATVAAAQLRKETLREPLEVFAAFFPYRKSFRYILCMVSPVFSSINPLKSSCDPPLIFLLS